MSLLSWLRKLIHGPPPTTLDDPIFGAMTLEGDKFWDTALELELTLGGRTRFVSVGVLADASGPSDGQRALARRLGPRLQELWPLVEEQARRALAAAGVDLASGEPVDADELVSVTLGPVAGGVDGADVERIEVQLTFEDAYDLVDQGFFVDFEDGHPVRTDLVG